MFGVLELGKDFWTDAEVCATICIEVRKSMFKELKDGNLNIEFGGKRVEQWISNLGATWHKKEYVI